MSICYTAPMRRFFTYFRRVRVVTKFNTRSRREYLAHRESARELVTERVEHFSKYYGSKYGITVGKISIRNQRSRWGSCSKNGNLNFNYKLLFLPAEARDYVIVHEICHIKEFNHAAAFWALVEEQVTGWRTLRRELRTLK